MIGKVKKIILDTLFPITCFGCQKNDFWLCEECFREIPIKRNQVCPKCEKVAMPFGTLCQTCRQDKNSHLDALISAASYNKPVTRSMIL